ncbi:MAG: hypothetical protein ABJH08_02120 [Balneola sp.]
MKYALFFLMIMAISCSAITKQDIVVETATLYIKETNIREVDDLYIYKLNYNNKDVFRISPLEQIKSVNDGFLPYEIKKKKEHYLLMFDINKQSIDVNNIPDKLIIRRANYNEGDIIITYNPEEWILVLCQNSMKHSIIRDAQYVPLDNLVELQDIKCKR